MERETALSVQNVSKSFGGLAVIRDVSFAVAHGTRTALIGPNGAGKTTLFNLLSGVYGLDSGQISLKGKRIETLPARKRIAAGLSRSFQNIRLMPHLSVVENVILGQHARHNSLRSLLLPVNGFIPTAARREAIAELEDAGLDVDPDAPVSGLPYGIRKRIEVVRALMSAPDVLMLDEPAAGLNPKETVELSEFLKKRAKGGLTLILVEHDMGCVRNLCDRTIVLNFGQLIYDGATDSVQNDAAVREAYLGSKAAMRAGEAERAA